MRCRQFLLIYVNSVAERLECVETDAHRQDNFHRDPIQLVIEKRTEEHIQIFNEEVEVFEHSEYGKIYGDISRANQLLATSPSFVFFQ